MVNVIIGGDVCPVGRNLTYFKEGDANSIFNDLLKELEGADIVVANLECPLIDHNTPIAKTGPVLGVESYCINGLKKSGIDILNLANNHIMDHGEDGLRNTLKVCEEAGISTVGAGKNLKEARQILIKETGHIRVGILGVAEREFSIATHNSYGANPLDLIDFVRNVSSEKNNFDYLIVLLHGGNEQHPFPSPRLRDTCRFMVETGANAVIVQHTHCPGCYEQYKGAYIVYGQGNLIFDLNKRKNCSWNKGFLVKLTIEDINNHFLNIVPYIQSDEMVGARRIKKDDEKLFLQEINERSLKIKDYSFVQEQWADFCRVRKEYYFSSLLPGIINNRLLGKLNKYFPFIEHLYSKKQLLRIENIIRCESHREVIETIIEEKRKMMK